jgi:hypothetical protein
MVQVEEDANAIHPCRLLASLALLSKTTFVYSHHMIFISSPNYIVSLRLSTILTRNKGRRHNSSHLFLIAFAPASTFIHSSILDISQVMRHNLIPGFMLTEMELRSQFTSPRFFSPPNDSLMMLSFLFSLLPSNDSHA